MVLDSHDQVGGLDVAVDEAGLVQILKALELNGDLWVLKGKYHESLDGEPDGRQLNFLAGHFFFKSPSSVPSRLMAK